MPRDALRSILRSSRSQTRLWARSGGLALLLTSLMLPSVATADDKELARTHFNRGVQLYHGKNLDGALAEFRRAYELAPTYRVLFNIGQLQFDLHEWSSALRTLEQYLAEGGDNVMADRKALVMSLLEKCREFVAHVDLTVETPGAVTLDEAPLGKSPLRSDLVMDPGKHRLTLAPEGGGPLVVRSIEVASGDRITVELAPAPEPSEPPQVSPAPVSPVITMPPEPPYVPPPSRTPAWITLGVTTALVGGTVAAAIVTNNAQNALERQLDNIPLDDGHVRDRRRDIKTAALTTDILGATAILGGVLTTYFFLRGPSRTTTTAATARSVDITVGPTSAGVSGTF